jgi:hypothetical protein
MTDTLPHGWTSASLRYGKLAGAISKRLKGFRARSWEPLQQDPQYNKLLAGLAPKD